MKWLAVFFVFGIGALMGADARIVEQIIAKVNGEIITRLELERQRQQLEAGLRRQGVAGERLTAAVEQHSKDLLRDQIDSLLLVQRAKDMDINVDAEVSRQLANMQVENKISDPEELQKWIREQSGLSYEDFREQMKNNLMTRRVVGAEVSSKINISRAEVEKYYEEHKEEFKREERVFLREILIATKGKEGAELAAAEKKAKQLLERARAGEKFPELARDNSDADTARNYGELGGFTRGQLRKDIEDLVFDKERGYISDLIKVDAGYLILKLEEKHKAGVPTLEECYNEVMERLYMPQFQPAMREYLTRLRQDAFLEIREGYVDTGAAPGKDTRWKDPAELKPETVTREEVAAQKRRRRLLWIIPIPGTSAASKGSSSSK